MGEQKRVWIDVLPLHPTAPMPDRLPYNSHGPYLHEVPKEARQDDRKLWKKVTVDVDRGEQTDQSAGASEYGPIPLPSPPNRPEAFRGG